MLCSIVEMFINFLGGFHFAAQNMGDLETHATTAAVQQTKKLCTVHSTYSCLVMVPQMCGTTRHVPSITA